ncbi:MAG: biotin--[acetyl-CoA-carboxylase] ligase [Bacteroidia bacterium]
MEPTLLHIKEVESTNDYLRSLVKKELPMEPIILLADYQTKGKGQREKGWESEDKQNILASFLVLNIKRIADLPKLNLAAVLSIAETLDEYGLNAMIKWPNDVFIEDQKIAGCLIENSLEGDQVKFCIVGIGLNVNQKYFPKFPACSMRTVTNKEYDRLGILEMLFTQLHHNLIQDIEYLLKKVNNRLYKAGEMVTFATDTSKEDYQVLKMLENGNLKVQKGNQEFELQHHLIKWQL